MNKLVDTAWKYSRRNPGLSLASTVILTITFSLGTVFLFVNLFLTKTVQYLQSQPTISVFYDAKEKEENILSFKSRLEQEKGMIRVIYVTQSDSDQYLQRLGVDPKDQTNVTTAEYRILRLQIAPDADYDYFGQLIEKEKNNGGLIMYWFFFKDITDRISEFSNTVRVGSILITVALLIVSVVLVYLTSAFTINRFSTEIEIMQLIGAERKAILSPFTIQGALYGIIAALIAYIITVGLWAIAVFVLRDNDVLRFIKNITAEVGLSALFTVSPWYIVVGLIEILIGGLLSYICSYLAVRKYIKV